MMFVTYVRIISNCHQLNLCRRQRVYVLPVKVRLSMFDPPNTCKWFASLSHGVTDGCAVVVCYSQNRTLLDSAYCVWGTMEGVRCFNDTLTPNLQLHNRLLAALTSNKCTGDALTCSNAQRFATDLDLRRDPPQTDTTFTEA